MTKYTLQLKINKAEENKIINFDLDLSPSFEDTPLKAFTELFITRLSQQVRLEANCYLTPRAIALITEKWAEDISLGYRNTVISVDLPSIDTIDPLAIDDKGTDDFMYMPIASEEVSMVEFFLNPELNF